MESNEVGWWMVPEEKHYVDRDSSILGGDEYDSFMGEFIWNLGVAMFPTCFVIALVYFSPIFLILLVFSTTPYYWYKYLTAKSNGLVRES